MQLTNKGTPIKKWISKHGTVRELACINDLSTQAIYNYIESNRDIRVYDNHIFEIKQLKGKG